MRTLILTGLFGLVATMLMNAPAHSDDAAAGKPLLNPKMKNWSRLGNGKSPWSISANEVLTATATTDSYIYEDSLGNGTLHLEWRFVTPKDKKIIPQASITVRGSNDGQQCKITLGERSGSINMNQLVSSDRIKSIETPATGAKMNPVDEWNNLDVLQEGSVIMVKINGKLVSNVNNCNNLTGFIALNAEGHEVEFRNVRWKAK